jgi:hypothetical protein
MHFFAQLSNYVLKTSLRVLNYLALHLLKQADRAKMHHPKGYRS